MKVFLTWPLIPSPRVSSFILILTYQHFKKTITLNVCRYVCTHVLLSFILICLARLCISKGRVDYPSLIHQCEHSTSHQVSAQYVFDEWMNEWHAYKMETQSLSFQKTHIYYSWFSVVSPSYWSYLLWTLKMPKSLLNNPQGLKYCCTYWGHKMHVCWMKRFHQEPHHPGRGRTANKISYFHLYPSSLREREMVALGAKDGVTPALINLSLFPPMWLVLD